MSRRPSSPCVAVESSRLSPHPDVPAFQLLCQLWRTAGQSMFCQLAQALSPADEGGSTDSFLHMVHYCGLSRVWVGPDTATGTSCRLILLHSPAPKSMHPGVLCPPGTQHPSGLCLFPSTVPSCQCQAETAGSSPCSRHLCCLIRTNTIQLYLTTPACAPQAANNAMAVQGDDSANNSELMLALSQ
jgi:hypothetical protein